MFGSRSSGGANAARDQQEQQRQAAPAKSMCAEECVRVECAGIWSAGIIMIQTWR